MGLWASMALGLALARPDRRVMLLAGDGDLLMNLQVLATIASAPVNNLRIVVFHNGAYSSTGGQALAAADRLSFGIRCQGGSLRMAWNPAPRLRRKKVSTSSSRVRVPRCRRATRGRARPARASRAWLSRGAHDVHARAQGPTARPSLLQVRRLGQ